MARKDKQIAGNKVAPSVLKPAEILSEVERVVHLLNITTHQPIFQYGAIVGASMRSIVYDYVFFPSFTFEKVQNDLAYYLLHTPIDVVHINLMPSLQQLKSIIKWLKQWLIVNPEGLITFDYPDSFIDLNSQDNQDFSFEMLDLFDELHRELLPITDLLIIDSNQLQPLAFHENDSVGENDMYDVLDIDTNDNINPKPKMLQHEAVYALIELQVKAVIVKGKHENTVKISDQLFTHEGLIMTQEHQRVSVAPCGLSSIFSMVCSLSLAQHRNYCDAFLEGSEYTQEIIKQTVVDENGLCDYQKMPNLLFWL